MTYKITCKSCKNTDTIKIDKDRIIWNGKNQNIISGRHRLDQEWGWECKCGNYDITTKQERRQIQNLQSPSPQDIHQVIKNLESDKPKFLMEKV